LAAGNATAAAAFKNTRRLIMNYSWAFMLFDESTSEVICCQKLLELW
jgi:hypothetical protein